MKSTLISLLIVVVFISCQRTKKENATIIKETGNTKPNIEQKLKTYCFYKLDDKYSIEKDSSTINRWLKEKSKLILMNDSLESIFNQNGGGPIGAEWNPSTDLYIAVLTSIKESTNSPKLFINKKPYENNVYEYRPYLTWYLVKQDFWEKEIRKIESNDMEKLFPTWLLKGIKNGRYNKSVISDFGEILKFDIRYEEQKITKFFHATYGE